MFTGLIQSLGSIKKLMPNQSGMGIEIEAPDIIQDIAIGDSVAVNGVCLTATACLARSFIVQAVHTTIQKTSIGTLYKGAQVNLELALRASDRLGGHIVQGHVNGLARIESITAIGQSYRITIALPSTLQRYCIAEGSIAIDGISLTIATCDQKRCTVAIIPHTWKATNLHTKKVGDLVNIEVDIIAKYVEKLLAPTQKESTLRTWLHT